MSDNTPETMTEQQRCHQKCLRKGIWYQKENKERLQKTACLKIKSQKQSVC